MGTGFFTGTGVTLEWIWTNWIIMRVRCSLHWIGKPTFCPNNQADLPVVWQITPLPFYQYLKIALKELLKMAPWLVTACTTSLMVASLIPLLDFTTRIGRTPLSSMRLTLMERICDTRKLNQPDRHRVATRLFKKTLLKIKIIKCTLLHGLILLV